MPISTMLAGSGTPVVAAKVEFPATEVNVELPTSVVKIPVILKPAVPESGPMEL
jgi:hypothetical protein